MTISQLISKLTMISDLMGKNLPVTVQGGTEDTDNVPFSLNVWIDGFKMGLSFDVTGDETDTSRSTAEHCEQISRQVFAATIQANMAGGSREV